MNQKGQIILILILVMTVALTIGLSIVQKSLVDVSTASKVEQSSRAFSAAEAGIEKALLENTTNIHSLENFSDNSSKIKSIVDTGLIPATPVQNPQTLQYPQQDALEKSTIKREGIAQVWLAQPDSTDNPPTSFYIQDSLEIYWGTDPNDEPALEVTIIYYNNGYKSFKKYFDPLSRGVGFESITCNGENTPKAGTIAYRCKKLLSGLPSNLILLRSRLLYNSADQPLAFQALGTCGQGCSFPPQDRKIISTGEAGETQRRIQIFQQNKVVPPFFDYAIFSTDRVGK